MFDVAESPGGGGPTAGRARLHGEEELGDRRIRASMIGPGGENLVRYACVMNETKDAAGRTGLGAVMGSKRLKAIAARGTLGLDGANPDVIREMARTYAQNLREHPSGMSQYGWRIGSAGAAAAFSDDI